MSETSGSGANTLFLLLAQYNGLAVVPLERVRQDFFAHLTMPKFVSKILAGEIDLPVVRMEKSQKSWRGVHVGDLASYIDRRRAAAVRERNQLCGLT